MSKPKPEDAELDEFVEELLAQAPVLVTNDELASYKERARQLFDRTRAAPQEWHCYVCDRPIGKSITPLFLCDRRECRFKMGFVEVSWDAPAASSGERELKNLIELIFVDGANAQGIAGWETADYFKRKKLTVESAMRMLLAWHAQQVEAAYDRVDRLEVIDETGIAYEKWGIYGDPVRVKLSLQDDNRTLKVFVEAQAQKEHQQWAK